MLDLKDKKILMTHTLIAEYMGSTIVCAQVAKACQDAGADVLVVSSSLAPPASHLFEEAGIEVMIESEESEIDLRDFDYVWAHSQLLPTCCIEQIREMGKGGGQAEALPTFIFNHMSAIDEAPDEHPYIPLLEETLASASVFVSQESHDKLSCMFEDKDRLSERQELLFPNPAPSEFSKGGTRERKQLRRCAIVSNHIPEELSDALTLLEEAGVTVGIIGAAGKQESVTPELLSGFDAVVTIGKTVQYCLVGEIPVFVYDRFGGFGYLDDGNFDAASHSNFSGRGGERKSASELAQGIIEGWDDARRWLSEHGEALREGYGMEQALAGIFAKVRPRESIDTPYEGYWEQVACQMRFAWRYYRAWDYEIWQRNDRARLEREAEARSRELAEQVRRHAEESEALARRVSSLEDANAGLEGALSATKQELEGVYSSWSFRIGFALMAPLRWLKRKLARGGADERE